MNAAVYLHPFLFDRDFDAEEVSTTNATLGAATDAAPASQVEQALAEARAEGYAEGHRSALAETRAATEQHVARALNSLSGEFAALGADLRRQESEVVRQAATLAVVICRKFLPSRYRETAPDEIAGLFATFLPRIGEMPTVSVRVAESLFEPLTDRLAEIARLAAFPGKIHVIADAAITEGDCRIDWVRGGVVRDSAVLWREVDALLEETVEANPLVPPATASHPSNPLQRVSRNA